MGTAVFDDLRGKTAVITGAGGGIGAATVRELVQQGVYVVATDLEPPTTDVFPHDRSCWEFRAVDVTDVEAVRALAASVARDRRLDIWVNNAGTLSRSSALELDPETWQRTLATNLGGTFFGAQAAARAMIESGGGAIVNLSSYAGLRARPNCADYAAAKAGVAHLTACLALEWGERGIRVNAIAPGYIETPMSSWMHADPSTFERYMARTPAGRLGRPEEIACSLAFLCSSVSAYMTGHVMLVDGGISQA